EAFFRILVVARIKMNDAEIEVRLRQSRFVLDGMVVFVDRQRQFFLMVVNLAHQVVSAGEFRIAGENGLQIARGFAKLLLFISLFALVVEILDALSMSLRRKQEANYQRSPAGALPGVNFRFEIARTGHHIRRNGNAFVCSGGREPAPLRNTPPGLASFRDGRSARRPDRSASNRALRAVGAY